LYRSVASDVLFIETNNSQGPLLVIGIPVQLTDQELKLASFLLSNQGKVQTTAMLLQALYAGQAAAGQKILDVLVCRIKAKIRKIAPGSEAVIRKIWGRGYLCGNPEETAPLAGSEILPRPERWVASHKGVVVTALMTKVVTEPDVLAHYPDMTPEELHEWIELFMKYGNKALKLTKNDHYRDS
jgi:DNA-binding winged helix-turn-helix (wHTH) protein